MSTHAQTSPRRSGRVIIAAIGVVAIALVASAFVVTRDWLSRPDAERGLPELPGNGVLVSDVPGEGIVMWRLGDDEASVIVPPPENDAEFDLFPTFSPDGRMVAFLRIAPDGESSTVMVANADGTAARALTGVEQGIRRFEWAPSGREIAYAVNTPDGWAVRVVGTGAGEQPRSVAELGPNQGFVSSIAWHPGGEQIIVADLNSTIISVGRDGGPVTELVGRALNLGGADVSPDGRLLAFTRSERVHVLDLLTRTRERTTVEGLERSVEFSPDGRWLVTTRKVEGDVQLFIRSPRATSVDAVGIGPVIEEALWYLLSPDGTRAVVGPLSDVAKAWVIDLGTREFEAIGWPDAAPPSDWQPSWP